MGIIDFLKDRHEYKDDIKNAERKIGKINLKINLIETTTNNSEILFKLNDKVKKQEQKIEYAENQINNKPTAQILFGKIIIASILIGFFAFLFSF